jgi:hypothetical protein
MKRMLLFASALLMLSFLTADNSISKKERNNAAKLLKDTQKDVFSEVKGLSEAQLKFKPGPDRWSVEECVKHIAMSEQMLWKMLEGSLKEAAAPAKRSEVKVTDEELIQKVEDRSKKIKTTEKLQPENTPYKSMAEALNSFKTDREKLITYVKSTEEDLRNHFATLPFGPIDGYQMILFIGAHSNRHTQQIKEVKADANFPKE